MVIREASSRDGGFHIILIALTFSTDTDTLLKPIYYAAR